MYKLKGFTLIEIMIALLIATIFLAAATPLITRKHATPAGKAVHGQYECFWVTDGSGNEVLHERVFKNSSKIYDGVARGTGQTCKFEPPKKVSYFLIQAVGAGGGGGAAGSALASSRETSIAEGSFPTLNKNDRPSWLSLEDFNAKAGNVTIKSCAGDGGKGGDTKYWKKANPLCTFNCSMVYIDNDGEQGGYGQTCTKTEAVGLITATTYSAKSGTKGANGANAVLSPSTAATAGSNGSACEIKIGASTTTGAGGTGGRASTDTITYEGSRASGAASSCSVMGTGGVGYDLSPETLSFSETLQTKFLTFGRGGEAGIFTTMFIPSLKKGIPITIGKGGRTGIEYTDPTTPGKGGKGGDTTFGEPGNILVQVLGGEGGLGYQNTGRFSLSNQGTLSQTGETGKTSTFSGFTQMTGMGSFTGMLSQALKYGTGGQGGGSWTTCTQAYINRIFNGYTIQNVPITCSDAIGVGSFNDIGEFVPRRGNSGAIVISW